MKRRLLLLAGLAAMMSAVVRAEDPGREAIGAVTVKVYFGTNGDPAVAGERASEVSEAVVERLADSEELAFAHYRELGSDRKPLYRSYENWAQPIAGSDEILCRFEVSGRVSKGEIRLDLELWLSRKKILKTGAVLAEGKPVLVLGPEWRGGQLIVSVELAPGRPKGQ